MNTLHINKIMKHDAFTKKLYAGTFAIDTLPQKIRYPSCIILNNKKSSHAGEHWLAIYYFKNKRAQFFDSFGHSPAFYNLEEYLKRTSTNYSYNTTTVQSINSNYCGLYVVLFLIFKARRRSLKYFLKQFKNSEKNDTLFSNLLYKHFI